MPMPAPSLHRYRIRRDSCSKMIRHAGVACIISASRRGVEGYICWIKSRKYHHNTVLFSDTELPKRSFNAYIVDGKGNRNADQEDAHNIKRNIKAEKSLGRFGAGDLHISQLFIEQLYHHTNSSAAQT